MSESQQSFDFEVRHYVYDRLATRDKVPSIDETAAALGRRSSEVAESFQRLADNHVLVLQAGGEILMAPPFSALPTQFLVRAAEHSWFGNCIWDALGILAMLNLDGRVETSCGCCGDGMNLSVEGGKLNEAEGIVHFAFPTAHWWDNVVFT